MVRKQQLIHFHGSDVTKVSASDIKKGEIIVLHPASGATQFGTLNYAGALVWFNDYESTKAYVDGLNSKMDERVKALEGLTGTTNSALQSIEKGTDGDYVTTTVSEKANNKQSVSVAVKVQKVSESNATGETKAMGLAEASDVKAYVDAKDAGLQGQIDLVKATADNALKTVTGENAIVATTGESQSVKVALKIDETTNGKGNVVFTNGENGLSANVTIPEATVTGVTGDILSLSNKLVNATVSLDYGDAETEALKGKKVIKLIGKDSKVLSEIDASAFIKDGMINSVTFDEKTHILTLTFNDDAGKTAIPVDLKSLVDTYKAGDGLELATDGTFSVKDEIARVGTDADTKASNTVKGAKKYADDVKATVDAYTVNGKKISTSPKLTGTDIKVDSGETAVTVKEAIEAAKTAGVTKFGGEIGDIELKASDSTNGTINLTMSGKTLQADIVGLKSAAYTESTAYDAAGEASKVLGTTTDDKTKATVYGVQAYVKEVEEALGNKNVSAGIPEGETLVNAEATDNKVTVSSTKALKDAVTNANSAIQNVTVENTATNKITVTKGTNNVVTINIDAMVIDCGEF